MLRGREGAYGIFNMNIHSMIQRDNSAIVMLPDSTHS